MDLFECSNDGTFEFQKSSCKSLITSMLILYIGDIYKNELPSSFNNIEKITLKDNVLSIYNNK